MAETNALTNRIVVVTGASSGIGRGTAEAFARAGATVVMAARRREVLQSLAQELNAAGARTLALATDVSQADAVERLALTTIEKFGHIDVWVNNAGVGVVGLFDEVPLRDHEQLIRTNLLGTLYGSYHALRHFRQRGQGTLINVSSMFGKLPSPYWASYVAAKAGLLGLADALRQEVRQSGLRDVHVCSVLPTTTDTPFFLHAANYSGHEIGLPQPMQSPQKVVDVILGLVRQPQDEVMLGNASRVVNAVHNVAPGVVENLFGRQAHRLQFGSAPAPFTAGAVQQPMAAGVTVAGAGQRRSA